jgi:hypothetical protein
VNIDRSFGQFRGVDWICEELRSIVLLSDIEYLKLTASHIVSNDHFQASKLKTLKGSMI